MSKLFNYNPNHDAQMLRTIQKVRLMQEWTKDGKRHQPVYESVSENLGKLYLHITFRCPLHCSFCFADAGPGKSTELPAKRHAQIICDAIAGGFREIVISGGEPLIYSEIDELMSLMAAMDKGRVKYILRTSLGFPIPEERLRMAANTFDEIAVSIDGDQQRHDSIRGNGVYQQALANLQFCIREGSAKISMASVMDKETFESEQGQSVRRLCESLGIRKLVVNSPLPLGRGDCKENREKPYFEWRSEKKQYSADRWPRFSCGFGSHLYVQPDGSAYPCFTWCEPEHKLGDLSKETLTDLLGRNDLLAYMNCGVETNEKCRPCEVRYLCFGRCKLWYHSKKSIDSGDFDCEDVKKNILEQLSHLDEYEAEITQRLQKAAQAAEIKTKEK